MRVSPNAPLTRSFSYPSRSGGLCPAWCRVKILASLVLEILAARGRAAGSSSGSGSGGGGGGGGGSRPRHWILYIDSDAYLREQHTDFLARLAGDPRNAELHFALAREEAPAGGFRSPRRRPHGVRTPSMNAGVLFLRASQWTSHLLAAWMRAPSTPVCAPFANAWPCEQQCFHELLRNRTMLPQGWRRWVATSCAPPCARVALYSCTALLLRPCPRALTARHGARTAPHEPPTHLRRPLRLLRCAPLWLPFVTGALPPLPCSCSIRHGGPSYVTFGAAPASICAGASSMTSSRCRACGEGGSWRSSSMLRSARGRIYLAECSRRAAAETDSRAGAAATFTTRHYCNTKGSQARGRPLPSLKAVSAKRRETSACTSLVSRVTSGLSGSSVSSALFWLTRAGGRPCPCALGLGGTRRDHGACRAR